jgi:aldose 1-epimerase
MIPIVAKSFGRLADGRETRLFTLRTDGGFQADVSDYGGLVVRLLTPDRKGRLADVVLGFDTAAKYAAHSAYLGSLIGRFGNRIAAGRFTLDDKSYVLATNNFPAGIPCHLHGGRGGFHQVLWSAEPATVDGQPALRLSYLSPDNEEGYPGNLAVTVTYTLSSTGELRIDYGATTDLPTPVNLTHHGYFNLKGEGNGDITDHQLVLHASNFTPVSAGLIPTGQVMSVAGTPLDFRTPHLIGERITTQHEQLAFAAGYDHNYVLDAGAKALPGAVAPTKPALAATLTEASTGRRMEVLTTEPGVQFYSGNFLDGTLTGKSGRAYQRRSGLCLETQHFPDSPNQPSFPNTILRPGETFRSATVFRFSAH